MIRFGRVVIGALSAGVIGCAEGGSSEAVAARLQAIIDGEASGPDQDGVLLLRAELDDGGELLCSSTLVAPNLLVTARHCVSYLSEGLFSCSVRGELFDNPDGGGRLGLHLPPPSIEVYGREIPRKSALAHGQQIVSTLSPSVCQNDLAFVVLDTALDLPLVPLRLGRSAELGEASVLIGYGMDGDDVAIDYRTQPRQQRRDLEIAAVGPDSIADGVTTVPPRALILQGPSGCIGDSGGPLLSQASGALLGVYSLLAGASCAAPRAYHQLVHVPPFQTLIDEAFAAANAEPLLEPEQPTGEAGAGAAGSPSGAGGATETETGAAGAAAASALEPVKRPSKGSSCGLAAAPRFPDADAAALALLGTAGFLRRRGRARSER